MHPTPKEKKQLKRLKKLEKLKEMREKVQLGIIEPPPQKIKLSNVMKIMASEITKDPTKTELEIKEQYRQRQKTHQEQVEKKKLTSKEKKERILRKLRRDSARGMKIAVFKITRVEHPKNKFKIWKNAKDLALVGLCLVLTVDLHSIVIVQGGGSAIKFYKKLLLRRIDWSLDKGYCELLWEADITDPDFTDFKVVELNEGQAKKKLARKNMLNYWNLANPL